MGNLLPQSRSSLDNDRAQTSWVLLSLYLVLKLQGLWANLCQCLPHSLSLSSYQVQLRESKSICWRTPMNISNETTMSMIAPKSNYVNTKCMCQEVSITFISWKSIALIFPADGVCKECQMHIRETAQYDTYYSVISTSWTDKSSTNGSFNTHHLIKHPSTFH